MNDDIIGAWRLKNAVEGIAEENDEEIDDVLSRIGEILNEEDEVSNDE